MNDTNNNLNGTVLGNVSNDTNINNNPIPNNENVEMLDMGMDSVNNTNGSLNQPVNNVVEQQGTYFNAPPINEQDNNNVVMNEVPRVDSQPAYTSLQQIEPAPMPGFENSGTIGTTPPMNYENEKKEQPKKKKTNKVLFIILVLIVLAGVGFGTYYILNYTDILNKESKVIIEPKDLELDLNSEVSDNITDYAKIEGTDAKNCSLDTTKIKTTEVGEYEFSIVCGTVTKNGKVNVVDNRDLLVKTKIVYKKIGSAIDVNEFIENPNSEYTYELVDSEAISNYLNTEGTYNIGIKVTSINKKSIEVDAKLVVLQYDIIGFLTCSSSGQNITDSSATMTISSKFAISKDNNNQNIYGKVAYDIYTFKYTDETEYSNLLATFKTDGKITINNITGDTVFNDEELTIVITNEKENDKLYADYGEATFEKYSTIKTYFEGTKGYTCAYKK